MSRERILIVDGDRGAARNLENNLRKLNYEVVGKTTTGEEALRLAAGLRPDLVILNTRLEGKLDGIQVAAQLQANNHLPAFFITRQSDEVTLRRIREVAPSGFLLNSYHPAELALTVEIALERQRSNQRLCESETLFRSMFQDSGTMMLLVDAQTSRILDANTAACQFYGYARQQMIQKRMTDLMDQSTIPAADMQERLEQIRRYPKRRFPYRHLLANGESHSVEVYSTPLEVNGSALLHVVIQDAAERTRTENTLRRRDLILNAVGFAAEQFFKSTNWQEKIQTVLEQLGRTTISSRVYIFENHPAEDGSLLTSMRFEWVAPGVTTRLNNSNFRNVPLAAKGLERWVQVLQTGGIIHGGKDDLPKPEKRLLEALNAQSILVVPVMVQGIWWGSIGFDQTQLQYSWANADIDALRAAAGILAGAIQRAMTQEAWTRAEEKYRAIFENAVEGVFQSTPEGRFVTANPALAHMLGYDTPQELMDNVQDIGNQLHVDPGSRDELVQLMDTQDYVKNFFLQLRRKDGSLIWVTEHARPVRAEDGQILYYEGFIQDITERKRAEDAAQSTYQRYIELVNSVEGIVWEADVRKSQFLFVSEQAERILGHPLERWFDLGFWERHIYAEDRAGVVINCAERSREMMPFTLEYRMVTANGRTIWLRDMITVLVHEDKPHRLSGLMVDVTEIHRHQHRQEVLVAVENALRSVGSSAEMQAVALDMLFRELPLDGAALALPDAYSGELNVVRGVGCFANRAETRLAPDMKPVYQALQDGLPFRHPAVHVEPDLVGWVRSGDPDALVVVPLTAEASPMGVLLAARRESFSGEDARMLLSFGGLVSNAIQRAFSNERMERSLKRVSTLHEIDQAINDIMNLKRSFSVVLSLAAAELGADALDVFEYNEHTQSLEFLASFGFKSSQNAYSSVRLGQGLAGQAVMEGRLVYLPDLREHRERLDRPTLLASEAMVTYYGKPLTSKDKVRGVLEVFYRKPFCADPEMLEFLEILAGQMALAMDNAALFVNLKRSEFELSVAYDETLEGWAKALEARDKETKDHSLRVTDMSVQLAQAMRVPREELRHIRRGALLHDIGKMGIPDAILLKEGPLTDGERQKMQEHTQHAYKMLSTIPFLRPALDIPYCHHEKWDGSGYPRGLKGKEIPLGARIFAVVDVWDALSNDRPYRVAWPEDKVLDYLAGESGSHFDPEVVQAFLKLRKGDI